MSEKFDIQVNNITKIFRSDFKIKPIVSLENISFNVKRGEIYGLIGPNGSGKSTIIKIILGLINPSVGGVRVFGFESGDIRARANTGFLPEKPYFYKYLSGEETLMFYGKLCSLRGKKLKNKVSELLEKVGLEKSHKNKVKNYSKGMLQRLGLAQALIQEPQLIILDEPTAGVDPIGSVDIKRIILDLKNKGHTILLCSHLLEQIQQICDRVAILVNGKIHLEGKLENILKIENQTSLLIENANSDLLNKIKDLIKKDTSANLLKIDNQEERLEDLFINILK